MSTALELDNIYVVITILVMSSCNKLEDVGYLHNNDEEHPHRRVCEIEQILIDVGETKEECKDSNVMCRSLPTLQQCSS